VTNLSRDQLDGFAGPRRQDSVMVTVPPGHPPFRLHATYGDVPAGRPLALFGSFELLEIGVRDGAAADHSGAGLGTAVTVRMGK